MEERHLLSEHRNRVGVRRYVPLYGTRNIFYNKHGLGVGEVTRSIFGAWDVQTPRFLSVDMGLDLLTGTDYPWWSGPP